MLTMKKMATMPVEDGVIYLSPEQFREYVHMPKRVNFIRSIRSEEVTQQILKDQMTGKQPVIYFKYKVVSK